MKSSKLENENRLLKAKLKQFSEVNGGCPWIDDDHLKGSFRVVRTIQERDNIPCCNRKQGMKVLVVGAYTYREYILASKKCENDWIEVLNNISTSFEHNALDSIQGGLPSEYYHLTKDEYDAVLNSSGPSAENPFVTQEVLEENLSKGDKNFIFSQSTPSSTWNVVHNLNKKVSVTITDSAGTVVEGRVTINDGTVVEIKFNSPFSGEVILN